MPAFDSCWCETGYLCEIPIFSGKDWNLQLKARQKSRIQIQAKYPLLPKISGELKLNQLITMDQKKAPARFS